MTAKKRRCKSQAEKLADCLAARAYMAAKTPSRMIHLIIDRATLLDLVRRFYPEAEDDRR